MVNDEVIRVGRSCAAPFGEHRLDSGGLAAHGTQPGRVLQLPALLLDTQVHRLLLEVAELGDEFFAARLADLVDFDGGHGRWGRGDGAALVVAAR
jgi:hypothetical protein